LEPENTTWNFLNTVPLIVPDQVHLWRVRLDGVGYQDVHLMAVLSVEEQDRAHKFHFDQHRYRFIRTHGISRMILAKYTGIEPEKLEIEVGARGKPFLAPVQNRLIHFNLSHSGDLMILAIAMNLELGVDVEIINSILEWSQIAANYFNEYEMQAIAGLPTKNEQLHAFYRVWTIKEAYLKARGDGLAGGLDKVVINLEQGSSEIFLALPGGEDEKRRWQAKTFRPATGACGAVVAQQGQSSIELFQYDWAV
jgi:4'-phosphopantetheinyl transferase